MVAGTVVLAVIASVLVWIWWPAALIVVPAWVWLVAFFRDPERPIPRQPDCMVSPADGRISDIIELNQCDLVGGPAVRVGIFLSIFNVHINRSPCDGKVAVVQYKKGKFINAMSHSQASEENESNTVVIQEPDGERPIAAVKQIVGLIARRIVCTSRVGDTIQRGQRIGMIKFGSRTELYIPKWLDPQVQVTIGQTVHGACDVIATLSNPAGGIAQPAQSGESAAK